MEFDPSKLAALRKALERTGQLSALLPASVASPSFSPPVSTGNFPSKPVPHYPPRTLPEPSSYRNIKNPRTKQPAILHAEKVRHQENLSCNGVLAAPPLPASSLPSAKSLRLQRREALYAANELLAKQKMAELQAAKTALQNQPHTDILAEIAGYDPNALQDPNQPVFRPKAGGRPDKTQRRHTIATIAESREALSSTYNGRCKIQEREEAIQEANLEVSRKIPAVDNRYTHRPAPPSIPFVPAVSGTEEERRRRYNLPTLQDEVILALENHLDRPPSEPVTRQWIRNRYLPVLGKVPAKVGTPPDTVWEMTTEAVPLPAAPEVFDSTCIEYQVLATHREFENAMNHLRFTHQWDKLDAAINYLIEEASYA